MDGQMPLKIKIRKHLYLNFDSPFTQHVEKPKSINFKPSTVKITVSMLKSHETLAATFSAQSLLTRKFYSIFLGKKIGWCDGRTLRPANFLS